VAVIQKAIGASGETDDLTFDARAGLSDLDPELNRANELIGDPPIVVEFPPDIELDEATPLISLEKADEIAARVNVDGTDALGWYVTFHQTAYQWGAYLSVPGISWLADQGAFSRLRAPRMRLIELARTHTC
jgi:hypothetical protein